MVYVICKETASDSALVDLVMRLSLVLLSLLLITSCQSRASRTEQTPTRASLTDEQLIALVNKLAQGAEVEPSVLQEIARYPRNETISQLVKLHDALPDGDASKASIAYLLCILDYETTTYKAAIVKVFTKEPHNKNNDADWEAELIQRLIKKGHTDLLPELLRASEWSDGALSESLSDFFVDQLRTAPQDFVLQLSRQPSSVRRNVCLQIGYGGPSIDDLKSLNTYLATISDPNLKATGREILTAAQRHGTKR